MVNMCMPTHSQEHIAEVDQPGGKKNREYKGKFLRKFCEKNSLSQLG